MPELLDTRIEFIKGIGPQKAALLNTELSIFTVGDLLLHFPFRYEDRSKIHLIKDIHPDMPYILLRGIIKNPSIVTKGRTQRLVATFQDQSGSIELVWFQGVSWVNKAIKPQVEYILFGKPTLFNGKINIAHPELDLITDETVKAGFLQPVYPTTERLKNKYIDSKAISGFVLKALEYVGKNIPESLPTSLIERYAMPSKLEAMKSIHFPENDKQLSKASFRLKFEEFFYLQMRLLREKTRRKTEFPGLVCSNVASVTSFYNQHLPFDLTNAQKRVIKEIRKDLLIGKQMNRLLQGDVGSGKTIVAFIIMLMIIDNDAQACLMAPTEILSDQHFVGLSSFAQEMDISIAKLTGSTKKSERTKIFERLASGEIKILIGTHALLEDQVKFQNLGLCVIDEQHRFGVAQRARLWNKNEHIKPHILVMTATPIPRTLAMTVYGDLDVSVIDEMPVGRKPIITLHHNDSQRLKVFGFVQDQIELGRQVYFVYPLIEESEKLDLKDLMDGFESICRAFPQYPVSILHGRMKSTDKDFEMQRFVKGETKIMVATTVIEVGVNVPNASVMVIESAERFGLAQLHQLRGRVGRGADQSYCILMSGLKLSHESKLRMETMVRTTNGFEIADVDLKLRGPGDLTGTQQSGLVNLKIADLASDGKILQEARVCAEEIIQNDPFLNHSDNKILLPTLDKKNDLGLNWGRIS